MALSPAEVARLADRARIEMTPEECAELAPQLGLILDSVAVVSSVVTDDIVPTTHALDLSNVFREDIVTSSLEPEVALANAPSQEDQRFKVPQILTEEE